MMSENTTIEQLFQHAYSLLREGRVEGALTVLEGIQPANILQKREVAYVRARCFIRREQWDEAAQFLLSAEVSAEPTGNIATLGQTERRRRAYYLLVLGNLAIDLGRYEEASHHYTQCIKCLDERRMNDTKVRMRALCGLGMASTRTGYFPGALMYYEEALRLYSAGSQDANLLDIYIDLCDIHRHLGNFDRALACGKEALLFDNEGLDPAKVCRAQTILGSVYYRIGDLRASGAAYAEALKLAINAGDRDMILHASATLADLCLQEEKLEDAWHHCELALEYQADGSSNQFIGVVYIVCGKVAEARAKKGAEGQDTRQLAEEAITFYQRAVDTLAPTTARSELAEAYSRLARTLEADGQQDLALICWRSAYSARAGSEDSPLMA